MIIKKIRKIGSILRILISLGLLIFIGSKINFLEVFDIISRSYVSYIILGVFCYNGTVWFEALRLFVAINQFKLKMSYWDILYIQYISIFYGTFIPIGMISSEIVKGYKLTRYGYSGKQTTVIVIILKLIGLYILIGSATLSIVDLSDDPYLSLSLVIIGLFILATSGILILLINITAINLLIKLNSRIAITRFNLSNNIERLLIFMRTMVEERKSDIIVIFLVTVVGYFIFICGNLFIISSLNIDISLLKMTWINGLTGISQLIPLGFFTFGGKDITYWFFLKELGITMNQIGAYILVINAAYVFNAIIGGIWEIIRDFQHKFHAEIKS